MTQKIVYGTDTGTYLGLDEAVVLLVPDDVLDLEEYIEEKEWDDIPQEKIALVPLLVDYFVIAMKSEGVSDEVIEKVVVTVAQQKGLAEEYGY